MNQLAWMNQAGAFTQPPEHLHLLPRLAKPDDTSWSREYRVRSYLNANCVQCHQPGGPTRADWDARIQVPLEAIDLVDAMPDASVATPKTRIVAPGDLENSVLYRRISDLEFYHMPPLGTSELDVTDVQLVADWILEDLPGRKTYAEWAAEHLPDPGSPEADPAADPDGDGLSNEAERLLGTDPMDAASTWRMTLESKGTELEIGYLRVPNVAFQIQWTEDPGDPWSWIPLDVAGNEPFISSYPETVLVRVPITGSQRFFRVQVNRP